MTSFLWLIYVLSIGTACTWSSSFPAAAAAADTMEPYNSAAAAAAAASSSAGGGGGGQQCGGILTADRGIIHTPNFPHKFPVPIRCLWIVDASMVMHGGELNSSIVVYFTQQYVLSGLTFTEYMYYSEDYQVKSHQTAAFQWNEDSATQVAWIRFASPYLAIEFTMADLYGSHLRAFDQLLDVYGFNVTYEVGTVKENHCNALKCRFLGHCYATQDFK